MGHWLEAFPSEVDALGDEINLLLLLYKLKELCNLASIPSEEQETWRYFHIALTKQFQNYNMNR